jgi:hypothetical protein
MANHPVNLILRFALEIAGLIALGYWGWTQHAGLARPALAIGAPLLAAVLWGVFRVPGDPGNAPVAVPGAVRLLLEAAFFAGAAIGLVAANQERAGLVLAILVVLHYAVSYDRLAWLLQR